MNVRPMTNDDRGAVLELWRSCEGVGLSEGDTLEGLATFLARNPGTSWVVLDEDAVVGAVLAGHDGRRGYLYHLAVLASHRHQGLGRMLVHRALHALSLIGIFKCHVMVFRDNAVGLKFWDHAGWRTRDDIVMRTRPR